MVGAALFYVEVQASRYWERRLVASARKTLVKQLDNSLTSRGHKARIRAMLEELEEAVAKAEIDRVKLIGRSSRSHPAPEGHRPSDNTDAG
jgi:hypothetical protein